MVDSLLPFVRMGALPLLCSSMDSTSGSRRAANHTTNTRLGEDRRGRFLLLFERWLRKFHTLQHGLDRVRMQRRVYYRWKKGQVVPRESALKRYCQAAGFDEQYVLTGIPGKAGSHLTISHYQEQHAQASTAFARTQAYVRIATESLLIMQEESRTERTSRSLRRRSRCTWRRVSARLFKLVTAPRREPFTNSIWSRACSRLGFTPTGEFSAAGGFPWPLVVFAFCMVVFLSFG